MAIAGEGSRLRVWNRRVIPSNWAWGGAWERVRKINLAIRTRCSAERVRLMRSKLEERAQGTGALDTPGVWTCAREGIPV